MAIETIKAAGASIELDWRRYLITPDEPTDIPQAQMVGFMQSTLAGQILDNLMLKPTAISEAGLTKQTLYEKSTLPVQPTTAHRIAGFC